MNPTAKLPTGLVKGGLCMFAGLLAAVLATQAAAGPVFAQAPTMNRDEIVFTHGGYLWSVPRTGGEARQITKGGSEGRAVFSPDGRWLAYSSEVGGNRDVYVMAAAGGEPRRLTFHPGADGVVGWTPDSRRILFRSGREAYGTFRRLYTVALEGGAQEPLPMWRGETGSYSPDGRRLAYVPRLKWQREWKRYRGGQTTPVWLVDLKNLRVEKIPRANSNDSEPVWIGDKVYFLSDREGPVALFAYDTRKRQVRRVLANADGFDLKSLSAGPDALVYEQFGEVRVLSLPTGISTKIEIRVPDDLPATRPRKVKLATEIMAAGLSPTGDTAVFEAHGEVVTVTTAKSAAINQTRTPGVAERDPAWSPDGRRVAFLSDESGEYALHLRTVGDVDAVKKIALPPSFYNTPQWSPDSSKILLQDKALTLWWIDVATGNMTRIATELVDVPLHDFAPAWSPDSLWVAYSKLQPSYMHAIHLYSLEQRKSVQITDGMSDARFPVFDADGGALMFASSTDLGPAVSWQDLSGINRAVSRNVYTVALQSQARDPSDKAFRIDLEGLQSRIRPLNLPAGNYVALAAGKPGILFLQELPTVAPRTGVRAAGATINRYDLATGKTEIFATRARRVSFSADGSRVLFRQGWGWYVASTDRPFKAGEGLLNIADAEIDTDPRAEWKQIYREVWRFQRDFFYDPNFHGLDLAAIERRYAPFVDAVGSREELNDLFREMLGDLTVGHMFVGNDGRPEINGFGVGLLGADYRVEQGRYRFARILEGDVWAPDLRGPLAGLGVKVGDYLLAVDGKPLTDAVDIYSLFQGTVGKSVRILVGADPSGSGAREVSVTPTFDETLLRLRTWEEDNRRKVDALSGGTIAYVHLPDTSDAGYANFNRFYFAQIGKQAAIIDGRNNTGGRFADYVIDFLGRPLRNCAVTRHGADWCTPVAQIYGPKTMIINEMAGSGGDALPWMFRQAGLGPLVGTRTWGGLTAGGAPPLMDGDGVAAPSHGHYGLNGRWEIENHGVEPDIAVENDPASVAAGHDLQLERAVEVTLKAMKAHRSAPPKRPPFPSYTRPWAAKRKP